MTGPGHRRLRKLRRRRVSGPSGSLAALGSRVPTETALPSSACERRGSQRVKVEPPRALSARRTSPPWVSAIWRDDGEPSPLRPSARARRWSPRQKRSEHVVVVARRGCPGPASSTAIQAHGPVASRRPAGRRALGREADGVGQQVGQRPGAGRRGRRRPDRLASAPARPRASSAAGLGAAPRTRRRRRRPRSARSTGSTCADRRALAGVGQQVVDQARHARGRPVDHLGGRGAGPRRWRRGRRGRRRGWCGSPPAGCAARATPPG